MIAEFVVSGILALTGFALLMCLPCDFRASMIWLSLPIGAAFYVALALFALVSIGIVNPVAVLTATGVVGVVAVTFAVARMRWNSTAFFWLVVTLAVVGITVIAARSLHLTRLTADSMRYLLFASDMQLPDAADAVIRADLLKRQMGLPSLHALSSLIDRRYFTSIGPLFGVSGVGFFVWFCWRVTQGLVQRRRLMLVGAAVLFVGSSNRLVYDAFYINTHIEIAVFLFIAIAGSWLAVGTKESGWMALTGLALGVTLLFRPEAPLVAAIVLVAVGATQVAWPERLMVVVPTVVVGFLWYGVILWQHAIDGDRISLTAPVFGSLVVLAGAVVVVLAGGLRRFSGLVSYADWAVLVALALTFIGLAAVDPDTLVASLGASFQNIVLGQGAWLFTWSIAVPLLLIALAEHEVPKAKLWVTPIVGFGITWLFLPMVRGAAWRVGTGDSGNRILDHMLLPVVAFLVLAGVPSLLENGSEPAVRESGRRGVETE